MSIKNFLAQRNVTAAFPSTLPDNTVQVSAAAIIDNTTFGLYWNALSDATNRNWAGIACSANGQYITGVVTGGSIYYSNNYAVTMTASASAGTTAANWSAVAMSASGQYQIATINSGSIYYSSNYGVTWAASATIGTTAVAWSAIAMSASGTYATAVVNGGQIWYSTNYGQTWTAIPTSAGPSSITLAWSAIAISASGQYQVAVINGGSVYYSSTFGFSWTASTTPGTTAVAWTAVAISASGQYVTAGISGAALWTSTNYGQTWTVTSLTGFLWKAIAMVSSGQYQLAVGTSSMYYSNNFGSTWTTTGSSYTIRCLAASTAGHYLFAGVYGGVVYQSVTRSPSIFTSGSIIISGNASIAGGASITGTANYPLTGTATQMYVNDSANPLMNLLIGSRYVGTTTSYGSIQASLSNTGPQMLVLNAAGGNVGIGTTNPTQPLTIYNSTGNHILSLINSSTSSNYMSFSTNGTNYGLIGCDNSVGIGLFGSGVGYGFCIGTQTATPICFSTNNIIRATIISSGNVGIGNASPGNLLTVGSAAIPSANSAGTTKLVVYGNINCYRNRLIFSDYLVDWNHSIYNNGMNLDNEGAFDGMKFNVFGGAWFRVSGTPATSSALFINSSGNVGIGLTTPSYTLHVSGAIYASGDITALSDQRHKQNITPLTDSLAAITQLSGYSYTRSDYKPGEKQIGMIAQEVKEVYPEAVSYDDVNDTYSLNYGCLMAPVIQALKEMKDRIERQDLVIQQLLDSLGPQ